MQAYRVEATLAQDNTLTLADLPFRAGETVEVLIRAQRAVPLRQDDYPLRGTPITYLDPTEPVALDDWESLR